ncbi:MAG TPA: hypothetical protein VFN78_05720 [Ktedonobacterales bacterium]|nr:hypothetical protein [Ktedonobacterales bacterium]
MRPPQDGPEPSASQPQQTDALTPLRPSDLFPTPADYFPAFTPAPRPNAARDSESPTRLAPRMGLDTPLPPGH